MQNGFDDRRSRRTNAKFRAALALHDVPAGRHGRAPGSVQIRLAAGVRLLLHPVRQRLAAHSGGAERRDLAVAMLAQLVGADAVRRNAQQRRQTSAQPGGVQSRARTHHAQPGDAGKILRDDVAGVGDGDYDARKTAGGKLRGDFRNDLDRRAQLQKTVLFKNGAARAEHHDIRVRQRFIAARVYFCGQRHIGHAVRDVVGMAARLALVCVKQHDLIAQALGHQAAGHVAAHMPGPDDADFRRFFHMSHPFFCYEKILHANRSLVKRRKEK